MCIEGIQQVFNGGALTADQTRAIGSGITAFGTGFSAVRAYETSVAQRNAFNYQAGVAENNAKLADWQARDAIRRGQLETGRIQLKAAQARGTARASLASRGLSLSEGSPLETLTGIALTGEMDAATTMDNARKEAWGHEVSKSNYESNASMLRARADAESPFSAALGTLLTGAGSVAERWYKGRNSSRASETYDTYT